MLIEPLIRCIPLKIFLFFDWFIVIGRLFRAKMPSECHSLLGKIALYAHIRQFASRAEFIALLVCSTSAPRISSGVISAKVQR